MMVKYLDIEDSFDYVNIDHRGKHEAYINIETGKTYWYTEYGEVIVDTHTVSNMKT